MDQSIIAKRMSSVVTGMGKVGQLNNKLSNTPIDEKDSFKNVLKQRLDQTSDLNFSKHAINRVMERNVDVSDTSMARLNEGVKMAQEKGLNDTLILVDTTAYIVNAKNGTVITTVSNEDIKGNVFTNIEGTVIM